VTFEERRTRTTHGAKHNPSGGARPKRLDRASSNAIGIRSPRSAAPLRSKPPPALSSRIPGPDPPLSRAPWLGLSPEPKQINSGVSTRRDGRAGNRPSRNRPARDYRTRGEEGGKSISRPSVPGMFQESSVGGAGQWDITFSALSAGHGKRGAPHMSQDRRDGAIYLWVVFATQINVNG